MIMSVNLGQISRNLKSAEIWNGLKTLYSYGIDVKFQISEKSGLKSRNLTQVFDFSNFLSNPRFWRNSPHYMWVKPQAFCPHVDVAALVSTTFQPQPEKAPHDPA